MESYSLAFRKSVAKDLRALPKPDVRRILARISERAIDPRARGCEKLSGQERYRVRQGNYRIIYEIREQTTVVLIVMVAHRREAYRL